MRIARYFQVIIALVVGLALGAGIARASIPDSNGIIHACYHKNQGTLTVIDAPSQSCGQNEVAIQWNQTGPKGDPGLQGPSGVVQTVSFAGSIGSLSGNPATFTFAGPTASVQVGTGQRMTGSASATIGDSSAGGRSFEFGLCYSDGTTMKLFSGSGNQQFGVGTVDFPSFATAGSVIPGAGSYAVGFCTISPTTIPPDKPENVSGFVQVTN
jgi:hypothetical protein